jgi:V/A-type H+-transporting ATPase subunit D
VIELKEERAAMHEGYVFLDEKCLLLAGEILLQLKRYDALAGGIERLRGEAGRVLRAAIARHGLEGLQCYPAHRDGETELRMTRHRLMGVTLQEAELQSAEEKTEAAANPTPEAQACRRVFRELLWQSARLAALSGNLERLWHEYRRAARRARALQDVLLPEIDETLRDMEARLDELEQEEARVARLGRNSSPV